MSIINKLSQRELSQNKKRSIGIIAGIVLSTALVCAVMGMFFSMRNTLIEMTKLENGDFHLEYDGLDEEAVKTIELNRNVESVSLMDKVGIYRGRKVYVDLYSLIDEDFMHIGDRLIKGRLPQNEHEVVLSSDIMRGYDVELGDTITLLIGDYVEDNTYDPVADGDTETQLGFMPQGEFKEYEFTIVGKLSGEYTAYTRGLRMEEHNVYIRFKNPKNYKSDVKAILGLSGYMQSGDDFFVNESLIRMEFFNTEDEYTKEMFRLLIIVIAIIIVTSVVCIKSSFDIAITEKMRSYGMLSSVGATRGQIRKNVGLFGMYLALFGIPLGLCLGELFTYILCNVVTRAVKGVLDNESLFLKFYVSPVAILVALIVGVLTVFLSVYFSLIRAFKVSPIENILSRRDVKINARKFKTPNYISRLFGIGGVIAHKNLMRSKRKYRTTIISLSASVFVFIAISSFITEAKRQASSSIVKYDYNIIASSPVYVDVKAALPQEIYNISDDIYIVWERWLNGPWDKIMSYDDVDYVVGQLYAPNINRADDFNFMINLLDDATFEAYEKKLGIEVGAGEAILFDYMVYDSRAGGRVKARMSDYSAGETVSLYHDNYEDEKFISRDEYQIKVGAVADIGPYGTEDQFKSNPHNPLFVVRERDYKELLVNDLYTRTLCYISTRYPDKAEEIINNKMGMLAENLDYAARVGKAEILLISIFMYGFITVISLIGVTNIFNTITSNMELRKRELAMLKSIGMTKKEFRKMINLETLFYSAKALAIGIALGLAGSLYLHRTFGIYYVDEYLFPLKAIIISIIFVFVIVYIIMRYSIKRINRQNTIEAIRRETV